MSKKEEISDLVSKLNKQLEEREEKKKKTDETLKRVEASERAKNPAPKPEVKIDKIQEKKELQKYAMKEKIIAVSGVFLICQFLLLTVCFRYPGQFFAIWAFGTFSICIICVGVIDLGQSGN